MASIKPKSFALPVTCSDSEFNVWMQMVRVFRGVAVRVSCTTCGNEYDLYMPKGPGEPSRCKHCGKKKGDGFSVEKIDADRTVVRS